MGFLGNAVRGLTNLLGGGAKPAAGGATSGAAGGGGAPAAPVSGGPVVQGGGLAPIGQAGAVGSVGNAPPAVPPPQFLELSGGVDPTQLPQDTSQRSMDYVHSVENKIDGVQARIEARRAAQGQGPLPTREQREARGVPVTAGYGAAPEEAPKMQAFRAAIDGQPVSEEQWAQPPGRIDHAMAPQGRAG